MMKLTRTRIKQILVLGCGWERSIGEDTDGNCGHGYEWDCDYCPIVTERYKPSAILIKVGKLEIKKLVKEVK